MSEKKTLSDLVDLLVADSGMDRTDAETFVRGMFELIEEALITERFVKVKGLGTFKLTDVDSRESVNVNTGERFEIQGHRKISFLPESTLKDLINKPFSHFENVLLNEGTELPDTEVFIENAPALDDEEAEDEEDVTSVTKEDVTSIEPLQDGVTSEEAVTSDDEDTSEADKTLQEETLEDVKTETEETPEAEEPREAEETPELVSNEEEPREAPAPILLADEAPAKPRREKKSGGGWKIGIALILLVVLFGLGYGLARWMESFSEDEDLIVDLESIEMDEVPLPTEATDSLAVDSLQQSAQDTVPAAAPVVEEKAAPATPVATRVEKVAPAGQEAAPAQAASTSRDAYQIVGTMTTHTLQPGETLRIIAEKYYGNRNLSKYIVKHNAAVITDPDKVPAGTQLNIPELQPTGE